VRKRSTDVGALACGKSGIDALDHSHIVDGKNENYSWEGFFFYLTLVRCVYIIALVQDISKITVFF